MPTGVLLGFYQLDGEQYVRVVDMVALLDEGAEECRRLVAAGERTTSLADGLTRTATYLALAAVVASGPGVS